MNILVPVLIGLSIIWSAFLTYYLFGIKSHYQRLVSRDKKGNLKEILDQILDRTELDKKNIEMLDKALKDLSEKTVRHIQKVSLVRFNPFSDTGGDQSFVLAILDGADCGIVLTSLHNRGIPRWYIKSVREGKGIDFELSEEENKAIRQAIKIKK